jgi:dolichol-phosphate mannosyltransferase
MISVVLPALNEKGNIPEISRRIAEVFNRIGEAGYEMLFVDDGSTDGTLEIVQHLAKTDSRIRYLSFSRNFGHQAALRAGLDRASGDCVITMDCDLQHPPELIPEMLNLWRAGNQVVCTIRQADPSLSTLKRWSSRCYYALFRFLSGLRLEDGAADFRLLDRRVVDVIRGLHESDIFLRGLIQWVGFRQTSIQYKPAARFSGKTKYSLIRMCAFASSGILAFTTKPLVISAWAGIVISSLSAIYAIYALLINLFGRNVMSGWTSIILCILFLGGIQLVFLGLIGAYLGRLVFEAKARPSFIISCSNLQQR